MTSSAAATGLVPAVLQPTPLVPIGAASGVPSSGGLSFGDILDAVNPLQHIPILSSIYRAASGTQISAGSQVAGDTLYGALLPGGAVAGFASSLANVAVKEMTGEDIGQHVLAAVSSSPSSSSPSTNATPLTPVKPIIATTTAAQTPITPIPLSSHGAHSPASQYQRAQALDAVNSRLVKLKI